MKLNIFDYDSKNNNLNTVSSRNHGEYVESLLVYETPHGAIRAATMVQPVEGNNNGGAVLFVHWYEPEAADSNRKQFLPDATELAKNGITSMLVETMWSDIDWFYKRTQEDDRQNSIEIVVELRQAIDILLSQDGIDSAKLAYVGHDFGAMYGTLLGSVDGRPSYYVLMAGTPRFPDWYLYYPPLDETKKLQFMESMKDIDPINHIANLPPAPILLQFGDQDPHVPMERAHELFKTAAEPKEMNVYKVGHSLNDSATKDRIGWLLEKFN